MTYLDTHATRTGRQDLRDRDADRSDGAGTRGGTGRLQDGTARWRLGGPRIVGIIRIGADHPERRAARDVTGSGGVRERLGDRKTGHDRVRDERERDSEHHQPDRAREHLLHPRVLTAQFSGYDELADPLDP